MSSSEYSENIEVRSAEEKSSGWRETKTMSSCLVIVAQPGELLVRRAALLVLVEGDDVDLGDVGGGHTGLLVLAAGVESARSR